MARKTPATAAAPAGAALPRARVLRELHAERVRPGNVLQGPLPLLQPLADDGALDLHPAAVAAALADGGALYTLTAAGQAAVVAEQPAPASAAAVQQQQQENTAP